MKQAFLFLFFAISLQGAMAQKKDYVRPAAIGFSFTMHDFETASRIRSSSLSSVLTNNQWAKFSTMAPGVAISYFKGLTNHIDFAGSLGGSFLDYPFKNRLSFGADYFLLEADASAQLKMTTERYILQPYLNVGVGGQTYKGYFGAFLPLGVGLKVNIFDEAAIYLNSQYRVPVTPNTSSYHMFHSFGIAGRIGKKKEEVEPPPVIPARSDRDGDGIYDDEDKCPDEKGVAKYQGCPVPDTDKDGINDDEDKCPEVPGVIRYQGCPVPDTDGDGINDEDDKCKDTPGVARYEGCPVPDSDGDGINDEEDKCPQLAGVPENQGCPAIEESVRKKVDYASQNIYFLTGSAKLSSKSNKSLSEVAKILNENVDLKLNIEGHTDNTGSAAVNQRLSQGRAESVKAYLVSKGIDESRLTAVGYGSDQPIADNGTSAGRAKNRRVEMKLGF